MWMSCTKYLLQQIQKEMKEKLSLKTFWNQL